MNYTGAPVEDHGDQPELLSLLNFPRKLVQRWGSPPQRMNL
jgi:hypothetical protein